jgi:hypothetical protein
MHQQPLRIDEDVALLAFDLFASVEAARILAAPAFSALFMLWLSMMPGVQDTETGLAAAALIATASGAGETIPSAHAARAAPIIRSVSKLRGVCPRSTARVHRAVGFIPAIHRAGAIQRRTQTALGNRRASLDS